MKKFTTFAVLAGSAIALAACSGETAKAPEAPATAEAAPAEEAPVDEAAAAAEGLDPTGNPIRPATQAAEADAMTAETEAPSAQ